MMITGRQVRASLAFLGWNFGDLSEKAGVSWMTVQRIAKHDDAPRVHVSSLSKVQQTLEAAGVEFIPGGIKVREFHQ